MVVIGIDQSYERTGISIAVDGKLKKISSKTFESGDNKTTKRRKIGKLVSKYCEVALKYAGTPEDVMIVCERVRTVTNTSFVRPAYIKSTAALIAYIVDSAYDYGIKVYSVDTRSWKSRVVGTSKPGTALLDGVKDPNKVPTIKYIIRLGFEESILLSSVKKGGIKYNDDAADGACIALFYFKITDAERRTLLQLET